MILHQRQLIYETQNTLHIKNNYCATSVPLPFSESCLQQTRFLGKRFPYHRLMLETENLLQTSSLKEKFTSTKLKGRSEHTSNNQKVGITSGPLQQYVYTIPEDLHNLHGGENIQKTTIIRCMYNKMQLNSANPSFTCGHKRKSVDL